MSLETPQPEVNFYPLDLPPSSSGTVDSTPTDPQPNTPTVPPNTSNVVPAGGGTVVIGGTVQSNNFSTGNAGWQLDSDGNLEANNGNFRGSITGASGTFSGAITATSGAIGGFNIGSDYVRDAANSMGLASTVTGGNDVRFWAGDVYANRASAPLRMYEDGSIVATNITATGTINATGGYIGTTTALVYESQGINTGTTGHIRGGQTDYDTGTGYFLGYHNSLYKLSLGVGAGAGNFLTWDGTNLTLNGRVVTGQGSFGGNGADGALTITSGTTTINCANAAVVIKNYSSISITGTGKLAFSNPNTNGTIIILKSQNPTTLTSSTAPMIDASGMGAAGGAAVTNNSGGHTDGNPGSAGYTNLFKTNFGGAGIYNSTDGAAGAISSFFYQNIDQSLSRYPMAFPGAGGGSGVASDQGGGGGDTATGGVGGLGGGGLIIECGGALNFTTTSGISVAGKAGGNGTATAGAQGAGAGGGGGGGYCLVMYNTLTANTGTITVNGGAAGTATGGGVIKNGGGGASAQTAGTGGAGGTGFSNVILNTLNA